MAFTNLHLHSEYSLLDGLCRIDQVVQRASELGQSALAITDHGNLHGIVAFYKACREHKDPVTGELKPLKPIIGCEVYAVSDRAKISEEINGIATELKYLRGFKKTLKVNKKNIGLIADTKAQIEKLEKSRKMLASSHHLILLAKDNEGYHNLIKIVTDANTNGFYYKPRTDRAFLAKHGKGIIALSACLAGEIPSAIIQGRYDEAKEIALEYNEIFDNFYFEVQPNHSHEQIMVNECLKQMSQETGIPLVATADTHYILKEHAYAHEVLLAIQTKTIMSNPNRWKFDEANYWLRSEQEMIDESMPLEAIANTQVIADMCNVTLDFSQLHLPKFDVPDGYDFDTYITKLCHDALFDLMLNEPINAEVYQKRMEFELGIIIDKGLSGYFLIVRDFIQWSRSKDILVGPGRGSAAGSLVSYLLGITCLDPIKHELLFERFLNPERKAMPDIDTDFPDDRRYEVVEYVTQKYGANKVCQIGTFNTMASRAVLTDVGRALEIDFNLLKKITKCVPVIQGKPMNISEAIEANPEFANYAKQYPQLFEIAMLLEDIPSHTGIHAAGILITPESLADSIPLFRGTEGVIASQFEKNTLESMNFVKFDFLGLITLSVIQNALALIKERHGVTIDINHIPLDDPSVYSMLAKGETDGVFQVESNGMRKLLRDLGVNKFETLTAVLALYRPGPLQYIQLYIDGHNGTRIVDYLVPELEPILKETYGIMVYQEQVMAIARTLAGYTPGQADSFRKAVGKKSPVLMEKELKKLTYGDEASNIPGLIKMGMDETTALQLADDIRRFAAYGFNKSHSAGYAVVAYQTAYLKAHYPLEYMSALISSVASDAEKVSQYIAACSRIGISILPPDVNKSDYGFQIEGQSLRFGLGSISGIGATVVDTLKPYRPVISLKDLIERIPRKGVNKKVLEALVFAGAVDSLVEPSVVDLVEGVHHINRMATMQKLFDLRQDKLAEPLDVAGFTYTKQLDKEKELLGLFVTGHPLDIYAKPIDWGTISNYHPTEVIAMISTVHEITTKKGDRMAFLSLDTLEGLQDVVLFPDTYITCCDRLAEGAIVKLKIIRDFKNGRDSLIVKQITFPRLQKMIS